MGGARVDACASRIDEPDHRPATMKRHGTEARDLLLPGLSDRAAFDREVVRRRADHASVDLAEHADDGVRRGAIPAPTGSEPHLRSVSPHLER